LQTLSFSTTVCYVISPYRQQRMIPNTYHVTTKQRLRRTLPNVNCYAHALAKQSAAKLIFWRRNLSYSFYFRFQLPRNYNRFHPTKSSLIEYILWWLLVKYLVLTSSSQKINNIILFDVWYSPFRRTSCQLRKAGNPHRA